MIAAPKPRIRLVRGVWVCRERGFFALTTTGRGPTVSAAYSDWRHRNARTEAEMQQAFSRLSAFDRHLVS